MTVFRGSDKAPRSQAMVLLRYTLIIAVAYLLLAEHAFANPPSGLILLIVAALASNVVIARLPTRITDSTTFNASIIVSDTLWISAALLYSGHFRADFFYVYFFVLLLAAIGENLFLIAVSAIVACTAYLFILSKTSTTVSVWSSSSLIRIPFLFTAAAFYGYLVDRVRREQQRALAEADTVARLEETQRNLADYALQLGEANMELEHEISQRKRAEQDLLLAKDYAQSLIDNSLDMIISANVDRNIVEFNRAAEEAFGHSKAEIVGKPIDILYADPSDGVQVYNNLMEHGRFEGEVWNTRKNGEKFCSYVSVSVIRDGDRVMGTIGTSRDITERKRVEKALQESEERYRKLVDLSPDAILAHSEGTIDYVNTAGGKLLGAGDPQQLVGTPVMDIVHPDYRELVKERIQQRIDEGTVLPLIEEKMIRLDGTEVDVEVTAAPITYHDKLRVQAVIRDITERKRAEKALEEARRQNEAILNSAGEGIYGLDLQGNTTFVNPVAAQLIGWEIEDLIGKSQHAILHHSKSDGTPYPREECPIYAAFKEGTLHHVDSELFWRKDGTSFPVEYTSTPIWEDGKIAGAVVTFKDITTRKQAEQALREANEELRETRQYLARLIESSTDAIMATDKAGNVALFNRGAETLLGYRREEVLGRRVTLVYESEEQAKEVMRRMRQGGGTVTGLETVLRAKDGSPIPFLMSASILLDEHGHEAGTVGFNTDLRERKRAEVELQARARELTTKTERLEALASLSHAVSASLNPPQVLDFVVEATVRLLNANAARLWLWDEAAEELRLAAKMGDPDLTPYPVQAFQRGDSIVGRTFHQREALVSDSPATDPRYAGRAWARENGIRAVVAVPLLIGDRTFGALAAARRTPGAFQEEELALLRSFAAQAAIALENARLYSEALEKTERLEGLIRTSARITGTLQVEAVLGGIAEEAANLLGVEGAGFRLLEGDQLVVRGRHGLAHHVMLRPAIRVGESLTGLVAQEARPIAVPNLRDDQLCLPDHKAAAVAHGVVAYLGVPLRYLDRIIGVLTVYGKERRRFEQREVNLLQAFADQAAIALENARHMLEAESRARGLRILTDVTRLMTSSLDHQQVMNSIIRAAAELLGVDLVRLWLCDETTQALHLRVSHGCEDLAATPYPAINKGEGVIGTIWGTDEPAFIPDLRQEPRWLNTTLLEHTGLRSFAGLPLTSEDRLIGVLSLLTREVRSFTPEERELMALFADQAAISLHKARLYREMAEQKQHLEETIRELRRAEDELKTTQLQLIQSAKFESVGQLAAGVAHEVKNPLAIILQGLTYLSDAFPTPDGDNIALILDKMGNAVRRADRVIKGLLDFSVPRGVDVTTDQLNAVVEQSLLLVKHEMLRAHVVVIKKLGGNLPPLKLDRNKIEQVFVNLFMNAIHAMPNGGTLTVKTDTKQLTHLGPEAGRWKTDPARTGETLVMVTIEDTGTGIPTEKLDRVFDPFFTTKPPGQGTGLGLSVTRKIIELHGGTIDIRNRHEGGVRVTITFSPEADHGDAEDPGLHNR